MTLSPCPLKPGLVCAATYELASASHCIGFPYLDHTLRTSNVPPNVGFATAHPPTGDVKKCITYPLLAHCKGYVKIAQVASRETSPEAVR